MDRALLKQNAKQNFKKDWFKAAIVTLIMQGASLVSSTFTVSQNTTGISEEQVIATTSTSFLSVILSILVFSILTVGGFRFFQKTRKNVMTDIGEVIGNFKDGNYKNIVTITFLKNLKIVLWSLLFFVPGIIKNYEYYLIENILAVRPDLDRDSAFKMSKAIMKGNKMDAFVLDLSFLGWIFLSLFTLGILSIVYVNPYMIATKVEFYAYVRAEAINKGIITPMDLPDYEAPAMNAGFDMNNGNNWNAQASENQFSQPQQTPFWQQSNEPVGNVDTMPNEEPLSENDATEVDFKPVDEE